MLDLLVKKRDGFALSEEEIAEIVNGFTSGSIPNYQMSAFLMAVYFKGMTMEETYYFTKAIIASGSVIDFQGLDVFDKHSTGGVGDKVTLILIPLLHSLGFTIAKMSGKGLGHTGGTIDKLESIPGFNVNLSFETFLEQVKKERIALVSQSSDICLADKLIYALRDVTGTVDSIPLIAASVISKKIASGAKHILIDLKVGNGAFMKTKQEALELARYMQYIADRFAVNVSILLTDMNEPLGNAVGNIAEVLEAKAFLEGNDETNLMPLIFKMTLEVLRHRSDLSEAELTKLIESKIKDGSALASFKKLLELQGGDYNYLEGFNLTDHTLGEVATKAKESGYLASIDSLAVGNALKHLGGGRAKLEDEIDYNVAVILNKHLGSYVEKGETIFTIYHNDKGLKVASELLENCYTTSTSAVKLESLFLVLPKFEK